MAIRLACLAALVACAAAAHAAPRLVDPLLTQDQVKLRKLRIEEGYDAAQQRCKRVQGHARELCNEQARGDRDVRLAELDMEAEPSADHDEKVRLAKAGAAFSTAMVKCKDYDGAARTVCRDDAKQVYEDAKQEAKLQKEVVARELHAEATVRARTLRAQYQAVLQRCAALPPEGRVKCQADARVRFDQP
jgi:hypothetical protein